VQRHGAGRDPRREEPPEGLQESAHADEDDRDERQRLVHLVEDPRHVGHDEGDQEEQDHAADEEHEQGVGEGRPDAPPEGLLLFAEVREPLEHEVQRAGGLPRPDHVQVERREDLGVMGQGLRKAAPLVDLLLDLGEDLLEVRVRGLRDQGRQRLHERQPGPQQGRQLPGHDRHLPRPRFSEETAGNPLQEALLLLSRRLLQLDQVDVALAQLLPGRTAALRVDDPPELLALLVEGGVFEYGHRQANLQTFCQIP